MAEEQVIRAILGMPVSHSQSLKEAGWVPYKNSVVIDCTECGSPCYVGPEQNAKRIADKMDVLCAVCLVQIHGADEWEFKSLSDKKPGE